MFIYFSKYILNSSHIVIFTVTNTIYRNYNKKIMITFRSIR